MNRALPSHPAAEHHRARDTRRSRLAGVLYAVLALTAVARPAPGVAASPPVAAPPGRSIAQQNSSPLYGVEVIVFRSASVSGGGEDWEAVPPGRGFGSNSTRGGAAPQVLRVLAAGDYRLGTIEATLKASGAWRPIAHAAWIQSAANWGTHSGIALADVGINVPELSGMVYLERAPIYLHLGFDVHLSAGSTYTIREMRSVRYNDKQYFDHPAFGIIAVVTPIKHAEATSAP
jgi:hypothetical protein